MVLVLPLRKQNTLTFRMVLNNFSRLLLCHEYIIQIETHANILISVMTQKLENKMVMADPSSHVSCPPCRRHIHILQYSLHPHTTTKGDPLCGFMFKAESVFRQWNLQGGPFIGSQNVMSVCRPNARLYDFAVNVLLSADEECKLPMVVTQERFNKIKYKMLGHSGERLQCLVKRARCRRLPSPFLIFHPQS